MLLRHAKAEQGGRDRDRALTGRGRADATAAGAWLAAHDATPDLVVVSPARRTVQTWEAAAAHLPASCEVRFDERIYDNFVDGLLSVIAECDPAAATLLLVGHNPSTHALAAQLGRDDPAARRDLGGAFPTATLAVFDLDGDWTDVEAAGARFVGMATCRTSGAGSD